MGSIVRLHLLVIAILNVIWAIRRRGPQGPELILAGGRRGDGGEIAIMITIMSTGDERGCCGVLILTRPTSSLVYSDTFVSPMAVRRRGDGGGVSAVQGEPGQDHQDSAKRSGQDQW